MPAIEIQRLHGFHSHAVIQPAAEHVGLNLPVLEVNTVPGAFRFVFRAGNDRAGIRGGEYPGGEGKFVEITEISNIARVDEALAVEARRRANTAGNKLRRAVLELGDRGFA